MTTVKKLYRVPSEKKISGVCAGLAKYFEIDPTIPRALFIASLLMGGAGLILYIVFHVMLSEKSGE